MTQIEIPVTTLSSMDDEQDPSDLTMNKFPTLGLVSKAAAEDNPNFGQAMNDPNAEGLWNAGSYGRYQHFKSLKLHPTIKRCEEGINTIYSLPGHTRSSGSHID